MKVANSKQAACLVTLAALLAHPVDAQNLLGFTAASSAEEAAAEARFKATPTAAEARRQLRIFTAEPHVAGSDRNNELARYIAREWKKQGLEDIVIRRYDVFSSDPKETSLEMVAPSHYRASLREAAYDEDPDTKNPRISSAWMGMSKSGDITAPVIYAHSGNPEDFALLRKNGIDVRGKIVLVRYSNPYSYRGFKALTAEREGAAAILIYSDPGVPERSVRAGDSLSARGDRVRLSAGRRSNDAGLAILAGRNAHSSAGRLARTQNHGAAAIVARREATARKHGWAARAGGLARRIALQISPGRRTGSSASQD